MGQSNHISRMELRLSILEQKQLLTNLQLENLQSAFNKPVTTQSAEAHEAAVRSVQQICQLEEVLCALSSSVVSGEN